MLQSYNVANSFRMDWRNLDIRVLEILVNNETFFLMLRVLFL